MVVLTTHRGHTFSFVCGLTWRFISSWWPGYETRVIPSSVLLWRLLLQGHHSSQPMRQAAHDANWHNKVKIAVADCGPDLVKPYPIMTHNTTRFTRPYSGTPTELTSLRPRLKS